MKYIHILFFLLSSIVLSQNYYTISGYIEDASSGESLIGVNVYSKSLSVGTTTNNFGFYSLTVPEGEFDINFSFIGYSDFTKNLSIKTDIELNPRLVLSSEIIKEVILTDQISNV